MRPFALVFLALAALPARAQQAPSFERLGGLPGFPESVAAAVSDDGLVVVGTAGLFTLPGDAEQAFRWAGGAMAALTVPGADETDARGVSADGRVVVGQAVLAAGGARPFRWADGTAVVLPGPPNDGIATSAEGVSADGRVAVGYGVGPLALRWTDGAVATLPPLVADSGAVGFGVSADGLVPVGWAIDASESYTYVPTRWVGGVPQQLTGAGRVPGMTHLVRPLDASPDGGIVVGGSLRTAVSTSEEAFRWAGGVVTWLGPGWAAGVSADGRVVVGQAPVGGAFVWTADGGRRTLREILVEGGINMDGWTLLAATDVSADGRVVVGYGTNPEGRLEGFRAVLSRTRLAITRPVADEPLVAGRRYRVEWTAPDVETVNLYYTADRHPDPDTGNNTAVHLALDADDGAYWWTVPDTLSPHVRLLIEDADAPTDRAFSARFRVKPFWLTRLRPDSTYERYRPSHHGWALNNSSGATWWPSSYYNQFLYGGNDPASALPYTADPVAAPFFTALVAGVPRPIRSEVHPSWPILSDAFGRGQAYDRLSLGADVAYHRPLLRRWTAWGRESYGGACYGLTVASALAFADSSRFGAAFPSIGVHDRLYTVAAAGPDAIHDVTMLLMRQWDRRLTTTTGVRNVLTVLKERFLSDERSGDVELGVWGASGGHAILPYALVPTPTPGRYNLFVYDSNRPGQDDRYITLDSLTNLATFSNISIVIYANGLATRGPLTLHYAPGIFRQDTPLPRDVARGGGPVEATVYPQGAGVLLAGAGGRTGWVPGTGLIDELDGALPRYPETGLPAAPYGYELPAGAYRLTLTAPADSAAGAALGVGAATLGFDRAAAPGAVTDRAAFGPAGTLTVRHDGAGAPAYALYAETAPAAGAARVLQADGLALGAADSVSVALLDAPDDGLRLRNHGPGKTYRLLLRHADAGGARLFLHADVPLGAGATHTVAPPWATLGAGPVAIVVDANSDGTPDDTLYVTNQAPTAAEGAPGDAPATRTALGAPYPNPAPGPVTVPFTVAAPGPVRVAVYDLLGREVARLVDAPLAPGSYTASFSGEGLSGGVYLVRLTVGETSETRRVLLVR